MSDTVGVIDIGSNSVKLLVLDGNNVVHRDSVVTRLGTGVNAKGRLSDESIAATRTRFGEIRSLLDDHGVGAGPGEGVRPSAAERLARLARAAANEADAVEAVRALDRRGVVELVVVGQRVDQPGVDGLGAEEGPAVQRRAHRVRRPATPLGDRPHQFIVGVAIERDVHLTMRGRHAPLGERVRVGLVVADVQQVGRDAQLVERAAEEQLVGGRAGHVELSTGHQQHARRRAGQVVVTNAAAFEIGHHRLARRAEFHDGRAQFLRWQVYLAAALYGSDLRLFYPQRYTTDAAGAEGVKARAAETMAQEFAIYADALGSKAFMLGKLSAVDIYAAMLCTWAPDVGALVASLPLVSVMGMIWL